MSEVIAETTDSAADANETRSGDKNVVIAENQEVHAQLAQFAKAVQDTMASAPSHTSDHDAYVVYGLCLCVPQAGEQDDTGEPRARHESPAMNVLLLTARDDWHTVKVVEVDDGESAETRRVLRILLGAMQKALAGDHESDPPALRDIAEATLEDTPGANGVLPHQKLSEREFQVVHMLSKGKTVGAISKELNLSVKTVSTYRVRALKKMNFKTNAELIRYMIQYKLG